MEIVSVTTQVLAPDLRTYVPPRCVSPLVWHDHSRSIVPVHVLPSALVSSVGADQRMSAAGTSAMSVIGPDSLLS